MVEWSRGLGAGVVGGSWIQRLGGASERSQVSTVPLFFLVALPTVFVVYTVSGLVRHAFGF